MTLSLLLNLILTVVLCMFAQPWKVPAKLTDIDDREELVFLLQGSPKLSALLPFIQQEVREYGENSVVWCVNPVQQFLVAAALSLVGIDALVYHTEPSITERQSLLHCFTTQKKTNTCMPECSFPTRKYSSTNNLRKHVQQHGLEVVRGAYGRQSMQGMQRTISEYSTTSWEIVTDLFRFPPQYVPITPSAAGPGR